MHRPCPEVLGYLPDDALEPVRARKEVREKVRGFVSDPPGGIYEDREPSLAEPDLLFLGNGVRCPREQRRSDQEEAQREVGGDRFHQVEFRGGPETR